MRLLPACLAVMLLAGCAGPRAPAPSAAMVSPPAQWRTAPDAGAPVQAGWWTRFSDPALSAVVETALARNTDVAIAAARVEEARAQFQFARALRGPNLVGSGGGGRQQDVGPFGTPRLQTVGQAQLSIAYDLDLFGRLANASESARASLLATEAGHDSVRLAVAATAASGYITLRALDARLDVLRNTLQTRAETLQLTKRRADTGYGPLIDLRQAEAEYHGAEQLIPATEAAIARQENGLAVLLGDNPRAIARGQTLGDLTPPAVPAGLPASLLRRRPDLAQAEQQLVAADRTLDSARAAFMPNIQLTAAGGYVASNLLDNPIGIFSLGGSILAPIFDSGRLQAQQGIAVARRDQAAFAYRRATLGAFREVDDALSTERFSAEQAVALAAQRQALAQVLALATNRYKEGYASYFEQIDARRILLAVELNLVQVQADRLTAAVALFQALGGGWAEPTG